MMGFILGVYGAINSFMTALSDAVMGTCGSLPLLVALIAVPISFVVLLAFGLFLMAWPLWSALILFFLIRLPFELKKDKKIVARLKTAAVKISEKSISYLRAKDPKMIIDQIELYSHDISVFTTTGPVFVYFEKDLNFDLSTLPKEECFYTFLANELIAKYPLPEHEYIVNKSTQKVGEKVVGYNYTQTNLNSYDNTQQVKFQPIVESSYYENIIRKIVKKQPKVPNNEQTPTREVL